MVVLAGEVSADVAEGIIFVGDATVPVPQAATTKVRNAVVHSGIHLGIWELLMIQPPFFVLHLQDYSGVCRRTKTVFSWRVSPSQRSNVRS